LALDQNSPLSSGLHVNRSKTDTAQRNEGLGQFVCQNVCCLIDAMYELGITRPGWKTSDAAPVTLKFTGAT
jgi:hypothetical protein